MSKPLRLVFLPLLLCSALGCPIGIPLGTPNDHYRPHGHSDTRLSISPDERSILFNASGTGGRDLYLLHLPDRRVTRITDTEAYETDPAYSPDGKHIVFSAGQPGDRADHIFVMRADGTGRKQLTNRDANDTDAAFSPDGKLVAFARDKTYVWGGLAANWDGGGVICLVGVDGKGERQITPDEQYAFNPSFSNDGKRVRYFAVDGLYEVAIDEGAVPVRVGGIAGDAVVLADERVVFSDGRFSGERELFVSEFDGANRKQLTNSNLGSYGPVANANGSQIYFLKVEWPSGPSGEPKASVWQVPVAGGKAKQLTDCRIFDDPMLWKPRN